MQVKQVAFVKQVAHGAMHFEHPPVTAALKVPAAHTHFRPVVIGKPSRQIWHRVAEVHLAQPVGHFEQPPAAAERKFPVGQTQAPVDVAGNPSVQVKQMSTASHVAQGATQSEQPPGTLSR